MVCVEGVGATHFTVGKKDSRGNRKNREKKKHRE